MSACRLGDERVLRKKSARAYIWGGFVLLSRKTRPGNPHPTPQGIYSDSTPLSDQSIPSTPSVVHRVTSLCVTWSPYTTQRRHSAQRSNAGEWVGPPVRPLRRDRTDDTPRARPPPAVHPSPRGQLVHPHGTDACSGTIPIIEEVRVNVERSDVDCLQHSRLGNKTVEHSI